MQGVKLYNIEKLLISNMVMRKEMILTQYMNFWWMHSSLFGICSHYRFPYI